MPDLTRGAHAALSPNLGAPATPAAWQAAQALAYTDLPLPASAVAGCAAPGAFAMASGFGAAVAAAFAAAVLASRSDGLMIATSPTGLSRLATASSVIPGFAVVGSTLIIAS